MRFLLAQSFLLTSAASLVAARPYFNARAMHQDNGPPKPLENARPAEIAGPFDFIKTVADTKRAVDVRQVEMVASAYYTQWHAQYLTLDDVSWDKYTHMYYAFKLSTEDPSDISLPDADAELLPQFVAKARENVGSYLVKDLNVKPIIAIGGWTGSRFFSTNVGDETNRTKFANAMVEFVNKFDVDGINFDWEYLFRQGIGCNIISPNDTTNFLAFLQQLKSNSSFLVTAAVPLAPFNDENGSPSTDVSGFADVFDWITLMNYDVWGSWSSLVGPNSPLDDSCADPANQQGSAVSAVNAWTAAGMPVDKICLGVASYGHAFTVDSSSALSGTELAAYPAFDASKRPAGDAWSDPASTNICGDQDPAGDTWNFWSLISTGLLLEDGTAAPGVPYRFDDCSKTDYLYNTTNNVMVSYDGPDAFTAKGQYIQQTGLRGFSLWEAAGDSNDVLLDAIRGGAGL